MPTDVLFTGFASVHVHGAAAGLPPAGPSAGPAPIGRWPTPGPRRAFLVPPFRAADVVPGLRTRRMDRLSEWALVGSALALQDAALETASLARDRTAVVCGTAFGCLERTEDFLTVISRDAAHADPILFPETLSNQPGGHVARHFGIRGPNLTIDAGFASGEAALLQAVSLLQAGQADRVLLMAGDLLTRCVYEWYEAASMLAPACSGEQVHRHDAGRPTIVPGEGLAACVLETSEVAGARQARVYGRYCAGWLGSVQRRADGSSAPDLERLLRRMPGGITPEEIAVMATPSPEFGVFGGSGLFQIGRALGRLPDAARRHVMVAWPDAPCRQAAAVLLAREARG